MKKKGELILCVGILLLFFLLGCSGSTSALIGKWVEVDDPDRFYVFLEDGKGIDHRDMLFTWSVPEGKYQITIQFEGLNPLSPMNFSVSGSKLILSGVEYKKW